MTKTKKTSSKKNESKNGSSNKAAMSELTCGISIAKGMLATLSLGHPSLWIKKYSRTDPAHLRTVLLEAMEGICTAEQALSRLKSLTHT
jgi:hypothetical protein